MEKVEKKKTFKMPGAFVILLLILVIGTIATWILPAGNFEYAYDEATGRELVVPGSYTQAEENNPVGPWDMLTAVYRGMVEGADIIFFILMAAAYVYVLTQNGSINSLTGFMLRKMGNRDQLIIPVFMILFGIGGTTFGMFEETYALIPAFVVIAVTLGYDRIVGGAIVYLGVAIGFAAAILNPFTIGIASAIAGTDLTNGPMMIVRVISFVLFMTVAIIYVMRYANKIKNDPTKSIMYGDPDATRGLDNLMTREDVMNLQFTIQQKLSLIGFVIVVGFMAFAIIQWGWYLTELATLFFLAMIITMIINKMTLDQMTDSFMLGCKSALFGALIIGFARSISVVMVDANIIDTAVNGLSNAVSGLPSSFAAVGMLVIQNLINFFIPSGSGQAAVMMPIMAPLADITGLSRDIAVLAYQFGDGFSNMIWPTAVAAECGIMGIGMNKWYRFILPLFAIIFILQSIVIVAAVAFGI